MTLRILSPRTDRCRLCALALEGLPRCRGFGPVNAEICVVGINPSVRATDGTRGAFITPHLAFFQRRGRRPPVLHGSERAFWEIAETAGLNLSVIYSTNAVKCATPGNRKPTEEEVRTCVRTHLMTELTLLPNLRTVLLLGRIAGSAFGLSDFGETAAVPGTAARAVLLKHPVATLRKWTRVRAEAVAWSSALGLP